MYRVTETPYESVMLVMVGNFIARDASMMPVIFLDLGISRDGFHISGLPDYTADAYSPLIGLPAHDRPNRYATWLQSVLYDDLHVSLHWYCSLAHSLAQAAAISLCPLG